MTFCLYIGIGKFLKKSYHKWHSSLVMLRRRIFDKLTKFFLFALSSIIVVLLVSLGCGTPLVSAFACFGDALRGFARLFRPHPALACHLPHPGEGFFGDSVASCNTSQQWRSRLLAPRLGRGSLCGDGWWVRVIFGGWCRFAQDDTVGDRGVVPNMFGANVSTACPPSSGASRHLPPRRGRLFRWCVALCNTS